MPSSPERLAELIGALEEIGERMDAAVARALDVARDATASDFVDVARQADSLRQQLLAAGEEGGGGGGQTGGQPPGGVEAGSGKGKGKRPAGMGRAFTNLQTQEEYAAYSAKARNVKTHGECKALLETTMKELEPRAKAENKPMSVNPTEICDSAKARGRLTD